MPTGVRIDQAKIVQWSNDLVRLTDNFPLEKLERVYTSMAKVRVCRPGPLALSRYQVVLLFRSSDGSGASLTGPIFPPSCRLSWRRSSLRRESGAKRAGQFISS